jgi:hypothetical protein
MNVFLYLFLITLEEIGYLALLCLAEDELNLRGRNTALSPDFPHFISSGHLKQYLKAVLTLIVIIIKIKLQATIIKYYIEFSKDLWNSGLIFYKLPSVKS